MENKASNFRMMILLALSLMGHFYLLMRVGAGYTNAGESGGQLIQVEIMSGDENIGNKMVEAKEPSSKPIFNPEPEIDKTTLKFSLEENSAPELKMDNDYELAEQNPLNSEQKQKEFGSQDEISGSNLSSRPGQGVSAGVSFDFPYPRCLKCPKPKYPLLARSQGISGSVRFRLTINEQGEVVRAEKLFSSGEEILEQSAERAISRWRFSPAVHNGKPGYGQVIVTMEFKLEEAKVLNLSQ